MRLPCILLTLPLSVLGETVSVFAATVIETVVETVTTQVIVGSTVTDPPAPPPPPPPPTTLATSFTHRCDDAYCSSGSKWCFYWGGITSYDVSRGPMPGETHTILGRCTNVTTVIPQTVITKVHTGTGGVVSTETSTQPAFTTVEEHW